MKKIIQFFRLNTFPAIIALSALSVSASAAFYSVTGLSKLFAGASTEVLIMASSLEIAKLVIASLLYQYWGEINKLLRTYLTIAATILVFITSAGIYGFLSAAYQETATKSEILDKGVSVLNLKKERFEENRNFYLEEKKAIDQSITDLRNGLSNNIVQYKDRETGQIITTQSSSNRKTLESQLNVALESRNSIAKKIENVTDSISSLDVLILEKQSNTELASELGPLKYLSGLTGIPMGNIVNWLMLVIIFVFDPLAISLVIAANFAFGRLKNKKEDDFKDLDGTLADGIDKLENEEKYTPTPEELESFEKYLQKVEESKKIQEQRIRQELEKTKYIPTDEDIERLQLELDKLMEFKKNQSDIENLENEIKLSEEEGVQTENTTEQLEELNQEENAEPSTSQPIRRLIYQKRDGRNTRFDRI
jgi:hypothetical protein